MGRAARSGLSIALAVAWVQTAVGAFGVGVSAWTGEALEATLPGWVLLLQMCVFTGASVVLVLGGRDARVRALAAIFAVVATSFARRPTLFLLDRSTFPIAIEIVRSVRVDAFLAFLVWVFFRDFPRGVTPAALRRVARVGLLVSGSAGAVLFAANLAVVHVPAPPPFLQALNAFQGRALYWAIVYGLTVLAFPFAIAKARTARLEERRRAVLFAAGLGAAVLPISGMVLAEVLFDSYARWLRDGGDVFVLPVFEALVLLIPMTTAYAVLVDRVLPVRVLLRQAMQYNLARAIVTAAALLPFAWVAWVAYRLRDQTLAELAAPGRLLALAGATGVGLLAVRVRTGARDAIDRTFFREAYDSRQILLAVAERSRLVRRVEEWAELIASELDRALHVEHLSVLVADRVGMRLEPVRGATRSLPLDSALARQLGAGSASLLVDLERADSRLRELPEEDRHWLADSALRLLVPVRSSTGDLIGILALGEKRSELAFTGEDRDLLAAVAASGALTLEQRLRVGSGPVVQADDEHGTGSASTALECAQCGLVTARLATTDRCPACGSPLGSCQLPLDLLGKFRLERREGEGGMGVVYRARDLALDRTVAIKTLPAGSPEDALLLRREARAMAAVLHPHLALIYSAESWLGTPLLVTEFLERGTLADRLETGPIPLVEARALGSALALALGRLHQAGILHRDVKPSNIGFSGDGTAKLLDFGLARMVREPAAFAGADPDGSPRQTRSSATGIVGTPLYMSPEALRGEPTDPGFDLWSLAVVLYEAVAGRHPLERATWLETRQAIEQGDLPALGERVPGASPALESFFRDALSASRRRRPATAQEFASRWSAAF